MTAAGVRELIRLGCYGEAEQAARVLLLDEEALRGLASAETAEALELLAEALWRVGQVKEPEGLELGEQAVVIRERLVAAAGTSSSETSISRAIEALAESLETLGHTLFWRGRYSEAEKQFADALELQKGLACPDNRAIVRRGMWIGICCLEAGHRVEAQFWLKEAWQLAESHLGATDALTTECLTNYANITSFKSFPDGSARVAESLVKLQQEYGVDHPLVAGEHEILSDWLLWQKADLAGAYKEREEWLAILERTVGPEHPKVAWALCSLMVLDLELGNFQTAIGRFERARAIFQKSLVTGHPDSIAYCSVLGYISAQQGRYAEARLQYEQALSEIRRSPEPNPTMEGRLLTHLARVLWLMGDKVQAGALFEESVRILEAASGTSCNPLAFTLSSWGELLLETGEYSAAKPLMERALAISSSSLNELAPSLLGIQTKLGRIHAGLGEEEAARDCFEQNIAGLDQAGVQSTSIRAAALSGLAGYWERRGNYSTARLFQERALEMVRGSLGDRHPATAAALDQLAMLQWAQGEGGAALAGALQAETIGREHFRQTARYLSEREALRYAGMRPGGLELALTLLAKGDLEGEAAAVFDAVVRSRGLVLDEAVARRRAAQAGASPELAAAQAGLAGARQRLARLYLQGPAPGREEAYRRQLAAVEAEAEAAARGLAERCLAFREERVREGVGLTEVSAALPAGAALAAYMRYQPPALPGHPRGPAAYLAFVLSAGGAVKAVPLGPAAEIEGLVGTLRAQVYGVAADPVRGLRAAEQAYRLAGAALRRRVWDPLAAGLAGAGVVYVVPDGALHLVDFAALPAAANGYLAETGPLLHCLTAERDLAGGTDGSGERGRLLALGDPDFDAPGEGWPEAADAPAFSLVEAAEWRGRLSESADFRALRFDPLPATAAEVDDVAGAWVEAGGAARVLEGEKAGEAALKALAPGCRVLHLATHGFFLGEACRPAGAVPTAGGEAAEGLLLRSGLALAGANRRAEAPPTGEDGVLTAEEAAALDLTGVDWVVLSACETGLGTLVGAGEGVFGLRRAFQAAGARTVIMSLWPVADDAGREWMGRLYAARLGRGLGAAAAVRQADRDTLRDRRRRGLSTHPFFWAGFVAAGDWR